MPLIFYKVIHLAGVIGLFFALGGVALHVLSGGTKDYPGRKPAAILHGIGLALIFVSGFGMMAKLGIMSPGEWPGWIWFKLIMWFVMGGLLMMLYRMQAQAKLLWWIVPLLGVLIAYVAIYKPF